MNHERRLIRAAAATDGEGRCFVPGAVLLQGDRIVAAGTPAQIGGMAGVSVNELRDRVVIPALVNAHSHLDLSSIGPQPFQGDFTAWLSYVRSQRAASAEAITRAVERGIALSRAGGVALVGDIAGRTSPIPATVMRSQGVGGVGGLGGVSFLEIFGLGARQAAAVMAMRAAVEKLTIADGGVRIGLQPHAPYSCGTEVYRAAASLGLPLATHLAETPDETEFVRKATGPLAEMLRAFGVWDDSIRGAGCHPIDLVLDVWRDQPFIAAHVNYLDDVHLQLLAKAQVTVAYCPRASAYFGHPRADSSPPPHPSHRYREMLAAGINVALGTDSLICLDTPDRISVLDEMRLLYRRDGVDPATLLRMATINGAKALGFRADLFTLVPRGGQSAGLLAIPIAAQHKDDPLRGMLQSDSPPEWLLGPVRADNSWFDSTARAATISSA